MTDQRDETETTTNSAVQDGDAGEARDIQATDESGASGGAAAVGDQLSSEEKDATEQREA
ncbi:hypothetical protein [Deinococcus hopiensis]|uniref:Uncharacterized protein n=1 Tax=Deinococcus hopiensis KR-140 TaxID=695939 RepID=A0A1W1UXX8_9DEIO|nr:hypothetical protein [Deinococcus hopiensis]SMB85965.1 hypothetical protein SAMN00790413_03619 [Deinococcus hopiensis KR-140]